MNVIAVDWRQGATFPYTQATANIRVVAMEIVKLIEFMQTEFPAVKPGDIHFIGHSLGAHAAGEVGTKIKGIGRISGKCATQSRLCCMAVLNYVRSAPCHLFCLRPTINALTTYESLWHRKHLHIPMMQITPSATI